MKNAFKRLTILYFTIQFLGLIGQGVPEELLGVWKYELPGIEAIGIFSPTHAAWMWDPLESTCRHASLSIL